MSETFSTALIILLVGMITIFLVLSLVVFSGNMLIRIVNRFYKEEIPIIEEKTKPFAEDQKKKIASIVSAVDIVTQGKGKITSIQKINE